MPTPMVSFRLSEDRMLEIQIAVERLNIHGTSGEVSITEFIRRAIDEKLRHMHRSRTKRRKKTDDVRYTITQ